MTINLSDNSPRVSYSVAAGVTQTSFTVSFEFFDNDDLNVYVDGVLKTLTTDYSVSGGDGSTGTITMSVTGVSGGSTVVITRDIDLDRTTDFPSSGPFNIASLNTELDRFVAIAADLKDQSDRTLQLTDYDVAVGLTLPEVDARKGKTLAFNSSTGAVEAGPSISDVQTVSAAAADIQTLAHIEDGTDATDAIQTVAGISSNVSTVAGNNANVSTVAGISANVTTVAGIASDVTDVAGVATEVGILGTADVVSDLNTLGTADVVSDMNTLGTAANVTNMDTVAGSITNVNTVATNISDINSFSDIYRVAATDPTTSLDEGDLFYDTTFNVLKYYNGTSWVTVAGFSLPTASASILGGVKVGTGLSISSGVLSADATGITIEDEGSALTTAASTLNFTGNGVVASGTTADKTITITDTSYNNATTSVAGLMSASDKTKLDGVEAGATADQSAAEIKTSYESNADTNAFTDAEQTKLSGIATSATANPNAIDNVVEDTTPQLGGNLDVNGNDIVSVSNGAVNLDPDGSGKVTFKGNATRGAGQFVLNCEQNSHGITLKGPAHSAAASYTLTLPDNDGNDGDALKSDGSGNLSFGTPYELIIERVGSSTPTLPVINATNTDLSIAMGHQGNVGADCPSSLAIMGTIVQNGTTDNLASISIGAVSQVAGGLIQTAIGPYAYAGGYGGSHALALGGSRATASNSTAVGNATSSANYGATASSAIAIGNQAKASHTNSVAIGKDSISSATNRISLGSTSQTVEISGAYRLPSSDGSASQVLQTDGSGTLTFATVSGGGGLAALVDDTTPQLGGSLDVNGNSIVSVSAGNIAITPDTTGSIILDGLNWPQADGSANQVLYSNGSGQLAFKTVLSNLVEDTTPQLGGNLDLNSSNITGTGDITPTGDIKPTTYQDTVGTESSGALNLATGNVFSHAPSANVTYVFNNPPSSGTAFGFTLKVSPSATITQTWPASVDWAGGTAPDATASGETDVFTFYTQDGGTTYFGFQAGNAMA